MKDLRNAIMISDEELFTNAEIVEKLDLFQYQLNEIAEIIEESGMKDFDGITSNFLPYDIRDISNIMYELKRMFK